MSKKEINQLKKEQKYLEEIKKEKTKYLVRARKGELWMDEHKDHYYNVVCSEYNFCYKHIKNMINVKHKPLIDRIIFHLSMFSKDFSYIYKYSRLRLLCLLSPKFLLRCRLQGQMLKLHLRELLQQRPYNLIVLGMIIRILK